MNVRKILGTLVCTLGLVVGATQAQAQFLETWQFSIGGLSVVEVGESVVANGDTYTWTTDGYTNTFNVQQPNTTSGTLTLPVGQGNGVDSTEDDEIFDHTVEVTPSSGGGTDLDIKHLLTLSFQYSIFSDEVDSSGNPVVAFELDYRVPLYSYVGPDGGEHVFYNANSSSTMYGGLEIENAGFVGVNGGNVHTSDTVGDFLYYASGISLKVDGQAFAPEAGGDQNFKGYVINSDTFGDGVFDVDGYFSLSYVDQSGPTPTPEPATMLLMGAGLVGLGLVARRRNSK